MARNQLLPFLLILLALLAHTFTKTVEGIFLPKPTHLRFFWHIRFAPPNPTAVLVAQASTSNTSPTGFGVVTVFDNPITAYRSQSSKLLGWSQGTYLSTDRNEIALTMALTFVFVDDKYNGSTFSVLGRNQIYEKVREVPIVGGTGVFRLAQGYCTLITVLHVPAIRYDNVEWNCVIYPFIQPQLVETISDS